MPTVRDVVCVIYALDSHYTVSAVRCIYPLENQLVMYVVPKPTLVIFPDCPVVHVILTLVILLKNELQSGTWIGT